LRYDDHIQILYEFQLSKVLWTWGLDHGARRLERSGCLPGAYLGSRILLLMFLSLLLLSCGVPTNRLGFIMCNTMLSSACGPLCLISL
jgi:hypothetical protein